MTFRIEYVVGSSGTPMAKTIYRDSCLVEYGETFEDAKRKLIETIKKQMSVDVPIPEDVEIWLSLLSH